MTSDDIPIPNDDPIGRAARRSLSELADADTPAELSWVAVQSSARRIRRRRLTAVGVACAIVLVGASAAIAAGGGDDSHVRIAGGSTTSSGSSTTSTSTSTPGIYNSSSVPSATATTTESTTPVPNVAPGPADVTGVIRLNPTPTATQEAVVAEVGTSVAVDTSIRNDSDHPIWAASSTVPTSYATVCAGTSPGAQSLWWMTNILLAPGDQDARTGTFTPTDAYLGTVTCELDVVVTDRQHMFDTSAGGDEAGATIFARVPGVPQVTMQVVPARWKVTTAGGVGPLQLGASTEAEVRAAAGEPDGTSRSTFEVPGRPDFNALGYDCSDQSTAGRISLHPYPQTSGPYCRTVFYVNVDTGTLAAFNTTSDRYVTANGVAVGTPGPDAEQLEGRPAVNGCFQGIAIGDVSVDPYEIFIWVVAGEPTAAVTSLSAEAASNQVGLMFC
jgi:hypothetical protein